MRKLSSGVFLLVILVLNSCCRDYPCEKSGLEVLFAGFDSAEVDTVIFRRFEAGTSFAHPLDTFREYGRAYTGDTCRVEHALDAGFEYEIYIPAILRTVRIDNVTFDANKSERICNNYGSRHPCMSYITSFRVDGQLVEITMPTSSYSYVIHR